MKCPKCGENLEKGVKFCTKCGANIELALQERVKEEAEARAKAEQEAKERLEQQAKLEAEKKEEAKAKLEQKQKEISEKGTPEQEKKFSKKEMKPKKKHTGLKVIVVLIFILLILICGVYGLYKIDVLPDSVKEIVSPMFETVEGWFGKEEAEEENKEKEENKIEENKIEDELSKIDDDKELVYDAYTVEINGIESKIPMINLESDNVESINDELIKLAKNDLEKAKDLTKNYGLISANYKWYKNSDVLSLVFLMKYGTGVNEYHIYNINIKDGKDVENSEILDMAKIDEEEFKTKAQEAVTEYFDRLFDKNDPNIIGATGYSSARSKTTNLSNFSVTRTPVYLNERGELVIIADITTLAGAGFDEKAINIENFKRNTVSTSNTTSTENTVSNEINTEAKENEQNTNTTNIVLENTTTTENNN